MENSSFFPDNLSRTEVLEKICEAYDNVIVEPKCFKTYWCFFGKTKEGWIIEMILTKKSKLWGFPAVKYWR